MMPDLNVSPYLMVVGSSLLWTIATQYYAKLVSKLTVFRFNFYKSVLALAGFAICGSLSTTLILPPQVIATLMFSGLMGFTIADLFLFYAFAKMGPARTMMIQAFAPLLITIHSIYLLGLTLPVIKLLGLVFLSGCLIALSLEKMKNRDVPVKIVFFAFLGVNFEAIGVIFTKRAFNLMPEMGSFSANFWRVLPAVVLLYFLARYKKTILNLADIDKKTKRDILTSTFTGTFLALFIYLTAISKATYPAIIAAIASLAPFYAGTYEHIIRRERPNNYFLSAGACVLVGLYFILFA